MTTPSNDEPLVTPLPAPYGPAVVDAVAIDEVVTHSGDDLPKVNARYIWFMVLAQFGVFMAFITPLAISLSIKVNALAPGHEEYLGYITGAGALFVMLTAPFMGIWSDRTRTRFGRRRPFMIGGMIVGVISLVVMALAPSVLILGFGWVLAQWGWGTVLSNLQISTADRLPESQRGKVAGLTGFATQVAPVFGVILTVGVTGDPLLLFLIPGVVGVDPRHPLRHARPRGRQPRASSRAHRGRRAAAQVPLQPGEVPRLLDQLARPLPLLLRPHAEHHLHRVLLRQPPRRRGDRGRRHHRARSAASECSP